MSGSLVARPSVRLWRASSYMCSRSIAFHSSMAPAGPGRSIQSDDENARRGYCLYKVGCRGPVTYNSCGIIRWNNGVSYPIQSGHPCIGCSEDGFWDNGPFYSHLAGFPGFGIESNADKIGIAVGAATVGGVAAHAVYTNVRKRRLIRQEKSARERLEHGDEGTES